MRYTDYNGYLVAGTLKSDNAGFSKWGIAQKDGQDYFLKEFLSPVYPQNASMYSPEQAEKRRKYCEKHEAQKTLLYKTINEASDGNDVRIVDFSVVRATITSQCRAFLRRSSRRRTLRR